MDNATYAAGLALLVTLLTSLFKVASLTTKQKNLIATALSLVAGVVSALVNGAEFTVNSLAVNAVSIYGASQIAYHYILSGTKLENKLANTDLFGVNSKLAKQVATEVSKEASKRSSAKKTAKPVAKNSRTKVK